MIDNLIGVELPLPVKLIVAFIVVLALIALATWVFRRLGGERAGPAMARGRQPRLAVIDAASVDGRRRLVLVRRDNVEHLIMIGGPTDLVIEQNIVRAVPVAPPGPRPAAEPAVRTVPPSAATSETTPPRPAAEAHRERAPAEARPRVEPLTRSAPRPEPTRLQPPPEAPRAVRPAPRREADFANFDSPVGQPSGDSKLADMASKLEAALRRAPSPTPAPRAEPESGPVLQGPTPPTVPTAEPATPPRPPAEPGATAEPAPPEPTPASHAAAREEKDKDTKAGSSASGSKSMFDSLEEEMASLLGRPPGKP